MSITTASTTASDTASDTGRNAAPARRRFDCLTRTAAVLTALATLGTVALQAAPAGAAVPEGSYSPTAVRCWSPYGQMDLNLGVSGAFDNQWIAVRHYYYVYDAAAGRWVSDVSGWEYRQVAGPNTAVIGGTESINNLNPGTYVAIYTQIAYWNGAWGPVRNVGARHFQNQGNMAGGYCRV